MLTVTFNLPRSGSISSITPLKLRNGPLLIFTVSPTSKLTFGFSCSSEAEIWFLICSTSSVGVGVGGSPHKPNDSRRLFYEIPRFFNDPLVFIQQDHIHEDIARPKLARGHGLLLVPHFDDFLHRDHDFLDEVAHFFSLDAFLNAFLDLL